MHIYRWGTPLLGLPFFKSRNIKAKFKSYVSFQSTTLVLITQTAAKFLIKILNLQNDDKYKECAVLYKPAQ